MARSFVRGRFRQAGCGRFFRGGKGDPAPRAGGVPLPPSDSPHPLPRALYREDDAVSRHGGLPLPLPAVKGKDGPPSGRALLSMPVRLLRRLTGTAFQAAIRSRFAVLPSFSWNEGRR